MTTETGVNVTPAGPLILRQERTASTTAWTLASGVAIGMTQPGPTIM